MMGRVVSGPDFFLQPFSTREGKEDDWLPVRFAKQNAIRLGVLRDFTLLICCFKFLCTCVNTVQDQRGGI